MNQSADEWLSTRQVLRELGGVPRSTFYRWRATGRGPKYKRLPNGQIRVRRADLKQWMDELGS
ncbi:helix-turn-helix domain-containing protein [Streptomyces sp. B6B3]|uniref:helix-turn-helix transcriptional regulator n=1 Tax=Streptomyces sp. B6B3 TaxID=3153570 RepID=UPI00325D512F